MGYESKFYIVDKGNHIDQSEPKPNRWAEVIASFDISKPGYESQVYDLVQYCEKTDCYIYDGFGEEKITEDLYGDPLREVPIEKIIDALKKDNEVTYYRRYPPLISMLESFKEEDWREITVLHFGH